VCGYSGFRVGSFEISVWDLLDPWDVRRAGVSWLEITCLEGQPLGTLGPPQSL
jgi:hypothetical protein